MNNALLRLARAFAPRAPVSMTARAAQTALTALTTLTVLGVAGCAATASPDWDSTFGERTRALNAQQLIDPAAPTRNAQNTPRADGRTTRDAMERQAESYRNPPPTNVINIGVGAGR
jgi:hypothetical protein